MKVQTLLYNIIPVDYHSLCPKYMQVCRLRRDIESRPVGSGVYSVF